MTVKLTGLSIEAVTFAGCFVIFGVTYREAGPKMSVSPFAFVTTQRYFRPYLLSDAVVPTSAVLAPLAVEFVHAEEPAF